jgi:hypothetical protein
MLKNSGGFSRDKTISPIYTAHIIEYQIQKEKRTTPGILDHDSGCGPLSFKIAKL